MKGVRHDKVEKMFQWCSAVFLSDRGRTTVVRRYGIAIVSVLVSVGIRYALNPYLASEAWFILFVPAVVIAALYGGLGPCLIASVSIVILVDRLFTPASGVLKYRVHEVAAMLTFIFSGLVVVGLGNALRRQEKRIIAKAEESYRRAELLQHEMEQRQQTEKNLRQTQRMLQAIVDYSPNMIFIKDCAGRYLFTNHRIEIITHRPSSEILGKTDWDLFSAAQAAAFRANDFKVMENGVAQEFEEVALHDDGPHTSIVHKFPLRDGSGQIYALGGIVTDITQRKRTEDALRRAAESYSDLVRSIDGIVWEANPDTLLFTFVSQKAERLLLYSIDRWLTERGFWENHLYPEDRNRAVNFCLAATRNKKPHDLQYRMIAADGRIVWLRDIVNVVIENNKVVKLRGVMVDITAYKEAEQARQESEEKYRALFTNAPVMVHSIDPQDRIVHVSDFWLESLGYEREEVIGRKSIEFLTPESRRRAQEVVLPLFFKTGVCWDVPYQFVKKSGEIIDTLLSATSEKDADGNVVCSFAVIIDVTAEKRAEQALRASEERLRILADTAGDAIVSSNADRKIIQFNRAAKRVFGYSAKEALGNSIMILMPERFRDACRSGFARFVETGESELIGKTVEMVGLTKEGKEFPLEASLSTWKTSEGIFFTAIFRDTTERNQAAEALRRSEELLRMATEGAGVGLWSWDAVHDVLEWNPVEYQQSAMGIVPRMTLQTFLDLVHPDDRDQVSSELDKCLREGTDFDVQYRIVRPDKAVRWRHCKGRPTYVDGRPVRLSGISLDITARKEAEEGLREARDRLAALAEQLEARVAERTVELEKALEDMESFLYSIAHDLRAPLRAMRGLSHALVEDYAPQLDETAKAYCDRINNSADRMDQLITDLLAYGRLAHLELPTMLVDLTAEIEKVLSRNIVQIEESHAEVEVDKPLPQLHADTVVLDQVLDNLVSNALKFVSPGRSPHIHIRAEPRDRNVRLWIEDNGIGIAPEYQQRIFGTFQRLHTAEEYPGTGIGLAIVQKGVEKMGGHVGVESEPGKGSRFWIELPA